MNLPDTSLARRARLSCAAFVVVLLANLSGCATSSNPKDPLEKFNRSMFSFNDAIDKAALKPAATAYKKVLPSFVQTGVSNFFGNLADPWIAVNSFLQGKGTSGLSDVGRFALNTTVGIGGLFDVASKAGLKKHNEDFGQTLGAWGVRSGPYLMLPLLGPSTIRDAVALPIDWKGDIWTYKEPVRWRNVGIVLRAIDERAALLDASNLMEEAALDRYEFIRDGYLQHRESRVFDGEGGPSKKAPPEDKGDAPADDKGGKPAPAEDKGGKAAPAAEKAVAPADSSAPVSSKAPAKELTEVPVTATSSGAQPGN